MNNTPVISLALNIHAPFVRHPEKDTSPQESRFFDTLSETCLPLLETFDRLDMNRIPWRLALSISPTLCHMLSDGLLLGRYLDYVDRRIEFGERQLKTMPEDSKLYALVKFYYNRFLDQRVLFTERYNSDVLKVFDYYQRKGRVELLTTAATHAFLPLFSPYPEALQAQLEVAIGAYRLYFERSPQGFWLPELGWSDALDNWLRSYNFAYTLLDTHALVCANPPAEKGSFYPSKTLAGIFVFGRDFYAHNEFTQLPACSEFRNGRRDLGYELPPEDLKAFLGASGSRGETGYKCADNGGGVYDPGVAAFKARECARVFLNNRVDRLNAAKEHLDGPPLSLCVMDFSRFWYEGACFVESFFREAAGMADVRFMTPADYVFKLDTKTFQTINPEYSSRGMNGYAEPWVDSSNDWIYRHTMRALERMTELAERFPDNTGLKERALNQAAREILLAMASDWPEMLYREENTEYAKNQLESALRNFTTIYEALGSNHVSTEWLTNLERRHNIFPNINYRVFRRKK